ncbi:hypothetical protein VNI00_013714 [Paramarasmius palmivorus]|uniref:Uncharacterized protein n=1 Tax=Paramarasmius palmivorus TaxID=297713 RepID=A0AAW0BY36_9AGAR
MKVAFLAYIVAAAGLVTAAPLANPNTEEFSLPHIRFGHGIGARSPQDAKITYTFTRITTTTNARPGCRDRINAKAIQLSNTFRQALGWPTIADDTQPVPKNIRVETGGREFKVLPFIGTPNNLLEVEPTHPRPIHRHHGHFHRIPREESFIQRLHVALMSLGPWESKAVAFVLGCGIGVLLRMFWVLAVVSYRGVCGSGNDESEAEYLNEYTALDAEEIFVAPPEYRLDEKVPIEEEERKEDQRN